MPVPCTWRIIAVDHHLLCPYVVRATCRACFAPGCVEGDIIAVAPVTWCYGFVQELIGSGRPFSTAEYMLPTPEWAVYGAPEQGFDPQEVRVRKVRNHPAKQHAAGFADAAAEVAIPA